MVFGVAYKSRTQACAAFGHKPSKIDHRLRGGMSLETALVADDRYTGAKQNSAYTHWNGMRSRCYSKSACNKRYKGVVSMCESWEKSFWAFLDDMGNPPSKGLTIERIDNNKGYSKDNCIWATRKQQARNRKDNVYIECFGKRQILKDWEIETGIPAGTISDRIFRGMDTEKALTLKPRGPNKKKTTTYRGKNES